MRWPFARDREERVEDIEALKLDAQRARTLVEESREMVLVLDHDNRVIMASRAARQGLEGVQVGEKAPPELLGAEAWREPFLVPYEINGHSEMLLYVTSPEELAAYEELRAGFTAAVSHELRTPLARILALLETAALPGEDPAALAEQARSEVGSIRELIDDVLFLSELETGKAVVSLGATVALPVVEQALERVAESADRAGVTVRSEGDPDAELPLRDRMLRVVVENLAQNAIRYAGPGSTLTIRVAPAMLEAADNGAGVAEEHLPRLFERFFRADRVRGAGGTGLGLAVVKHIVTAAGGSVQATETPGGGLTIRCVFTS